MGEWAYKEYREKMRAEVRTYIDRIVSASTCMRSAYSCVSPPPLILCVYVSP